MFLTDGKFTVLSMREQGANCMSAGGGASLAPLAYSALLACLLPECVCACLFELDMRERDTEREKDPSTFHWLSAMHVFFVSLIFLSLLALVAMLSLGVAMLFERRASG